MITLGTDSGGKRFRLDVDRLVTSRMLLQANSGGGKSWALRRLLEQTHGKVQQLVIDPEGEFYTLREQLDYVLAGKGGDCPAEVRSADLLARRLLELGCSAIVDIQELSPADRRRFVARFVGALMDAPRKLWHPALVVVDEAHTFAPQNGSAESGEAIARLMSAGRKRGFCGVLATQRISKLHKDVAAEANNMLIGRARQDVDRKRAAEELGFVTREDQMQLRTLAPGEFFAFGPAFKVDAVERITVGDVKTTHPEGGAGAPPVAPPRAKVKTILGELADLPAEAEEEARTVEALRLKIRDLEREAKSSTASTPRVDEAALERVRDEARAAAQASADELVGKALASVRTIATDLVEAIEALEPIRQTAIGLLDGVPEVPAPAVSRPAPGPAARRPAPVQRDPAEPAEGITGPMQKILDELATLTSFGLEKPQRAQLALLCGYTNARSGGFTEPLGKLHEAGLVAYHPKRVEITSAGLAAAAPRERLTTHAELHDAICAKLSGPDAALLRILIERYPEAMSRSELAEMRGYSNVRSGGFTEPLGRLRALGLIDYPGAGEVVALPVLFP